MMVQNMSYIEKSWDYLWTDLYGQDEFQFVVFGTAALQGGLFWGLSAMFAVVDLTGKPTWMRRFKTQKGANEPLDRKKLWKALKLVFVNQVVVSLPYLMMLYYAHRYMGSSCRTEDLPTLWRMAKDFVAFHIVSEFTFYYLHRYIQNVITTIVHHSGYHLPLLTSPEFHDYHHLKFNCNYGSTIMWLDWLHGTDKAFMDTHQKERHYIFYDTTPRAEKHPEKKKIY